MGNSFDRINWLNRLIAATAFSLAGITAGFADQACREDAIALRGAWGNARFNIEIADDAAEQQQGLMNRPFLPTSSGMLFVYDTPRSMSFWMRNTLIPLDMIFLDAAGVVQHIHHQAIPLDETAITVNKALTSVLEINGGLAKRMGISVGSQAQHPSFDPALADWPC